MTSKPDWPVCVCVCVGGGYYNYLFISLFCKLMCFQSCVYISMHMHKRRRIPSGYIFSLVARRQITYPQLEGSAQKQSETPRHIVVVVAHGTSSSGSGDSSPVCVCVCVCVSDTTPHDMKT